MSHKSQRITFFYANNEQKRTRIVLLRDTQWKWVNIVSIIMKRTLSHSSCVAYNEKAPSDRIYWMPSLTLRLISFSLCYLVQKINRIKMRDFSKVFGSSLRQRKRFRYSKRRGRWGHIYTHILWQECFISCIL